MATDGQAFNKVKNLLNRMDRSIDEARDKRLGKSPSDGPLIGAGSAEGSATGSEARAVQHASTAPIGAPASTPPLSIGAGSPATETSKSGFGRAKPLVRPAPNDSSTRRWGT